MHEQSETVERDGGWVNVYGKNTPKAGQVLPGESAYMTVDAAEEAARKRSESAPKDRSQVDWFDHIYQSVHGELLPEREKVEAAHAKAEEEIKGIVLPAAAKVKAAADAPSPPIPKTIPQPPVPDLAPRSFLAVQGKESLPALINGLTHLTTTIMGARNAPQAGLAALTGAMQGWSAGDAIRASRSWKEYLGYVDKVKEENDQAWHQWEAAMSANASNLTRATAQFSVAMVEAKMPEYAAAAADRGMKYAEQDLQTTRGIVKDMMANSLRMTIAQGQQALAESRMAETRRHNLETEALGRENADIRREQADQKKEKKSAADQKHERQVDVMQTALNQMKALLPQMEKKGFLQQRVGPIGKGGQWLNTVMQSGDPTLAAWGQHTQTIVGFDRTVMNDLARAQNAYAAGQEFIKHPPTKEGTKAIIDQMQELIDAEKKTGKTGAASSATPKDDYVYNPATGKLEPAK